MGFACTDVVADATLVVVPKEKNTHSAFHGKRTRRNTQAARVNRGLSANERRVPRRSIEPLGRSKRVPKGKTRPTVAEENQQRNELPDDKNRSVLFLGTQRSR